MAAGAASWEQGVAWSLKEWADLGQESKLGRWL